MLLLGMHTSICIYHFIIEIASLLFALPLSHILCKIGLGWYIAVLFILDQFFCGQFHTLLWETEEMRQTKWQLVSFRANLNQINSELILSDNIML